MDDVKESLHVQPSPMGYIAKAVVLLGDGDGAGALCTFDLAVHDCERRHQTTATAARTGSPAAMNTAPEASLQAVDKENTPSREAEGVAHPSTLGDLIHSLLPAPKAISFYDSEWRPYLGNNGMNHKKSWRVMNELATLSRFPAEPSTRSLQAALGMTVAEEDAYSLIGIFKLDFRLHYGEGADNALGHLLEEIVARYVWRGKEMETYVTQLRHKLPQQGIMLSVSRLACTARRFPGEGPAEIGLRVSEMIARLGQPFNALLLLQQLYGEYKRAAADNEIVVPGLGTSITSEMF
ncbi:hypothetical protein EDC04DRAFT_2608614 [Pisolithus marmoratus]|nr:hypothetical protein EDC04DRAFT_2608614 [Pisolithus marmoratus]